jgi:hypothetical protein
MGKMKKKIIIEAEMTLRDQVVAEIMKLVRQPSVPLDRKPTIDELEKILNDGSGAVASINPDGTVTVQPPPCTVGDVADAVLRVFDARTRNRPSAA